MMRGPWIPFPSPFPSRRASPLASAQAPLFDNDQGSEWARSTGFSVHNGVHIPAIEPHGFIDDQANPGHHLVEVTRPPPAFLRA